MTTDRRKHYLPAVFVLGMFAAWFVFDLLARIVLTCTPGGDVCVLKRPGWPLQWLLLPHTAAPSYLYHNRPIDLLVSLLTLFLAIWVVSTAVYTDDVTESPQPPSPPGPPQAAS